MLSAIEIADDHSLPLDTGVFENLQPIDAGAVYRPHPTWCVKMLEPGTTEAEKGPAERAMLKHISQDLPVPRLLAHGVTRTRPVRVFCAYEWIEGRLWRDVLPNVTQEDRLRLLHEAGRHLGKLHAMGVPTEYELTEIPRGNYRKWRSRNVPILDSNLSSLVEWELLTADYADRVRSTIRSSQARLFQTPVALVHGDFGGQNILVRRAVDQPEIAGIIDWGNVGVDPLEADYEMVLLNVLLPEPTPDGTVTPYAPNDFREMCRLLDTGYSESRGLHIDWSVMWTHALLQWVKRCVNNYEKDPPESRSLACSIRMATDLIPGRLAIST